MRFAKKSQVEIQFNWIFVLVVGAIILSFFVTIALSQKKASEQQISIGVFSDLEAMLNTASMSPGTSQPHVIPKMNLHYDCTSVCTCALYDGNSQAKATIRPYEMPGRLIFSPDYIKGIWLTTWSKEWKNPFRIANFLFMTSPEVKYLIEDSNYGQIIFEELPDEMTVVSDAQIRQIDKELFTSVSDLEISGNYKVKFVFTTADPKTIPLDKLQSLPDGDVSAIKIDSDSKKVIFYTKKSNKFVEEGSSNTFGDATIYAAIFAENHLSYACMMNNAFKKLIISIETYAEKQDIYYKHSMCEFVSSTCCGDYNNIALMSALDLVKQYDFFNEDDAVAQSIRSELNDFSTQNADAIDNSCSQIY